MATTLRGIQIRGIQLRGSEFLTPNDIADVRAWWQWKTGITTVSGAVSQWLDSSNTPTYHLNQGTAARRPSYNTTTGLITPDGTADYLANFNTRPDESAAEFTFVIQANTSGLGYLIGLETFNTVDADVLTMRATNQLFRSRASASSQLMTSLSPTLVAGTKYVASFTTDSLFINGVQPSTYGSKITGQFNGTFRRQMNMFANCLNSGGNPTTANGFGATPIFEACWHGRRLTALERTKLVTYFRTKHGI